MYAVSVCQARLMARLVHADTKIKTTVSYTSCCIHILNLNFGLTVFIVQKLMICILPRTVYA